MEIRPTFVNPQMGVNMSTGVPAWSFPANVTPRVDIIDTGNEIMYLMDMAGVDPDKLVLEISRTEVAVNGPLSEKIPRGTIVYAERPRGSYTRILALPREVDSDQASADINNGVLMVRFPKRINQ
ncbi:MAG: Hsp20/alpha crystallin family protein [Bacillota bacterium]